MAGTNVPVYAQDGPSLISPHSKRARVSRALRRTGRRWLSNRRLGGSGASPIRTGLPLLSGKITGNWPRIQVLRRCRRGEKAPSQQRFGGNSLPGTGNILRHIRELVDPNRETGSVISQLSRSIFDEEAQSRARKPASALPPPSFEEVTALLAPSNTPAWLKKYYLESWAPSLAIDRGVSAIQPTRVIMKKQLKDFSKAAALVEKALTDTPFMEFLQGAGRAKFQGLGGLQQALRVIAQHAEAAARGPELTTEAGKTRERKRKGPAARRHFSKEDLLRNIDRRSLEILAWRLSGAS